MWRAQTPAELSSLPASAVSGGVSWGEFGRNIVQRNNGAVNGFTISSLQRVNNQVIPLETPTTSPIGAAGSALGLCRAIECLFAGHDLSPFSLVSVSCFSRKRNGVPGANLGAKSAFAS